MTTLYQLTHTSIVLRDGVQIPADPANLDRMQYAAWLEAGNTPEAAAPAAAVPARWTPLQFLERFTDAEQLAVVTAAMSLPALRLWYDKLLASQEVVATDPRLGAGLDVLVGAGFISPARRAELLG